MKAVPMIRNLTLGFAGFVLLMAGCSARVSA